MIPIPRAGTLVGVHGQAEARAVPGVTDIQITIAPGRNVVPVPEGNRYLGFVFAATARRSGSSERCGGPEPASTSASKTTTGPDRPRLDVSAQRGPATGPDAATVGACARAVGLDL